MAAEHVTCDAYIANMTSLIRQAEQVLANVSRRNLTSFTSSSSSPHRLSSLVNDVLGPAVCLFGVVGNALNLIVLTRRRLQHSMDGLERSVRLGLVGSRSVSVSVSSARFGSVSSARSGWDLSPSPSPTPSSASCTCWPPFCCRSEPSTPRTKTAQRSTSVSTTR